MFLRTAQQSRVAAAEIAKRAYWNSSYFGGELAELLASGFINHPPVAIARNATVDAGPACTATIRPDAIDGGAFDPDSGDALTLSVDPGGAVGRGQHTVSLVATDSHGASSASSSVVTVADRSAPVIEGLAVDQPVLWPPRHRMALVTLTYTAADNCGPVTTELMVSSSAESDDRRPDWEIVDAHHVRLRAEREGHRDRIYWITVAATDGAGNHSAASVKVRVPGRRR